MDGNNFGKPLSLFKTKDDKTLEFNLSNFNTVLAQIQPENLPIAVVSIIGAKRLGKTTVMNEFLKYYFKNYSTSPRHEPANINFFRSCGGATRVTVGIDIWSKPLIVSRDQVNFALLLLDCEGDHDEHNTPLSNSVLYTITHLLSSSMIFNVQSQIDEQKLDQLVVLSNYMTEIHKAAPDVGHSYPSLLFLLRDFQHVRDYGLGYSGPGEIRNGRNSYFEHVFGEESDMSSDSRSTRTTLKGIFAKLGMFMMPHPGYKFLVSDQCPSEDFQQELTFLIQYVLNSCEFKRLGNVNITKNVFQNFARHLDAFCATGNFPQAHTVAKIYKDIVDSRRKLEQLEAELKKKGEELEKEKTSSSTKLVLGVVGGGIAAGCVAYGAPSLGATITAKISPELSAKATELAGQAIKAGAPILAEAIRNLGK